MEYQPASLKQRRAFEFETLSYQGCGSVEAYACKFVELCDYAPSLVATEEQKVQRFIRGLPASIRRVLASQDILTFASTVDKARVVEDIDKGCDRGMLEGSNKRTRSCGSSVPQRQRGGETQRRPQMSSLQGISSEGLSISSLVYYTCHQPGHTVQNCPQAICFQCQQTGHIARDCSQTTISRTCTFCGKTGHTIDYCWSKKDQGRGQTERDREQPVRRDTRGGRRGRGGRGRGRVGQGQTTATPTPPEPRAQV